MQNELLKIKKPPYRFHIIHESKQIQDLDDSLPKEEVRKYISFGGFSSIAFVKFISEKAHINHLYVSTLRVGAKHLTVLNVLHKQGKLDKVSFICGTVAKAGTQERRYNYYEHFLDVINKNKWEVIIYNNHSKILLFDTNKGDFVIETSSNLNENPNMEQFSFEKNKELFDFYKKVFSEIKRVK